MAKIPGIMVSVGLDLKPLIQGLRDAADSMENGNRTCPVEGCDFYSPNGRSSSCQQCSRNYSDQCRPREE